MRCSALLLVGLFMANAALAQPGDPLDSPGCRQALAALRAAEDQALDKPAASPRPPTPDATISERRRDAARACLRAPDGAAPARSPHVPLPPDAARTTRIPIPALPPAPATPVVPSPPAALPPPPQTVTACDATGCWTSNGTRLQRFGTELIGPRGVCTMQGVVLNCG